MNTVPLTPNCRDSIVALKAVEESIKKRPYPHYIKTFGKIGSKGVMSFSHLSVTTSYDKATAEGYLPPDIWLSAHKH